MTLRTTVIGLLLRACFGCVERSVKITTKPAGALVYLTDREVGRTPVTVPFQWYGDYDVILRKEGMATTKTHQRLIAPWFQYPPIDFFAELLWPATIYDEHSWHFEMEEATPADKDILIERAKSVRDQAQQFDTTEAGK